MNILVNVTLKGGSAGPASLWLTDDGSSSGPTKGTGSNGGNVNQIELHEGMNTGVSKTTILGYLATAAGKALLQSGGVIVAA